jgi:hypothetical protein
MSLDFTTLLKTNADDATPPTPLPVGTYLFTVKGHDFGESSMKKTPFVKFECSVLAPEEDVDEEALPENWQGKVLASTFYITQPSLWRLSEFLQCCGLNTTGRPFDELIPETTGCQFKGYVTQQKSSNTTATGEALYYNSLDQFAPAE